MVGLRMVKEDKRFDDMLRRQGERRQLRTVMSFKNNDDNECRCNADDAMMNATNKTKHTTKLGVVGSLLERRSRGITTLHHYKRISSRDLGWHRREMEEEEKRLN